MKVQMKKVIGLLAGLLFVAPTAQADVAAAGQAIATALNQREPEAMMRMLDVDAIVRRVVKDLGVSTADREQVRKEIPRALRTNLGMSLQALEASKGSVKFLRSGARDGKPYALVRYDFGEQSPDYVEYYLTPSHKVEDWYVHSVATLYSTSARFDLATVLKTDSMLFDLFGARFATQADAPFTELRSHLQAQDFAKAYRVLEDFPESYRKSRQWALMRVSYASRIDQARHRAALRHLARNFGKDADLQFMLIDHYFFEQQFDRALETVGALERSLGGEDAATANLRGTVLIAMQRFDDAANACRRGMALEPDHKPAYLCLVDVGIAAKSGRIAVEGLRAYEKAFAVEFDLDKLAARDEYKEIARTPEFAAWAKSRR
jgi:tetratricopeptide (TPR) repeat protein